MIKGLYTAASGMMLQMKRQDVIANNIANVNTTGFKKDTVLCKSFPDMLISRLGDSGTDRRSDISAEVGRLGTGAVLADISTDYSVGNMQSSGNNTDFAISGEGYFVLDTPEGERFSRNGLFSINSEGILVNKQGYPVLDTDGESIYLDNDFTVDKDGNIAINNEFICRIKIVDFADKKLLQKEGDFLNSMGQSYNIAAEPGIMQGYKELSNVNAITEMVEMINVVRAYESCQKVVQAEDESIQTAIEKVGSVT